LLKDNITLVFPDNITNIHQVLHTFSLDQNPKSDLWLRNCTLAAHLANFHTYSK